MITGLHFTLKRNISIKTNHFRVNDSRKTVYAPNLIVVIYKRLICHVLLALPRRLFHYFFLLAVLLFLFVFRIKNSDLILFHLTAIVVCACLAKYIQVEYFKFNFKKVILTCTYLILWIAPRTIFNDYVQSAFHADTSHNSAMDFKKYCIINFFNYTKFL